MLIICFIIFYRFFFFVGQTVVICVVVVAAQQLRTLDGAAQPPRPASPPGDHLAVERLQSALSTKVVIERRHKGGRIVLHWYDDEQLEQIVNQITSNQTAPDISVPDEFDI